MQSIAAFFPWCFVGVGRETCADELWGMEPACSHLLSKGVTWSFPPVTSCAFKVWLICAWDRWQGGARAGGLWARGSNGDHFPEFALGLCIKTGFAVTWGLLVRTSCNRSPSLYAYLCKIIPFLARLACCTICYTAACGLIPFLLVFNLFSWYLHYCCFVLVQLMLGLSFGSDVCHFYLFI